MSDPIQILLIVALLATAFGAVIYARIGTSKTIWRILVSILIILSIANLWYFFRLKRVNPDIDHREQLEQKDIEPMPIDTTQGAQSTQPTKARRVSLEGRVINRRTLAGVHQAIVTFGRDSTTSDTEGEFYFSNVMITGSGTKVIVSCPGFFPWDKIISPGSQLQN
jgi:hypothetical protein